MDDLDVLNMMREIEERRASLRETMQRIERWQRLMIGIVLVGSGIVLIAGAFR